MAVETLVSTVNYNRFCVGCRGVIVRGNAIVRIGRGGSGRASSFYHVGCWPSEVLLP